MYCINIKTLPSAWLNVPLKLCTTLFCTKDFSCKFRVIIEMIKPEKLDGSTTLKTLQYIDVPGQIKKDCKIDFHAHKEGTYSAKVRVCVVIYDTELKPIRNSPS